MSNYKPSELKELQSVLIEMLDDITTFCDKHNLTYFLAGGTALGAVRHGGMIPWDDDVDILMPREDYEKFLKLAIDNLDDKYFVDYYKTNKYYHKHHVTIRKNNTTFKMEIYERCPKDHIHQGIYLDILPLDYVASKDSKKTHIKASLIRCIEQAIRYKNHFLYFKHIHMKYLVLPLVLLPCKVLHYLYYKICVSENNKTKNYLIEYCAIVHNYRKVIYNYDMVFPPKKIMFAGKKYNVFNDCDKYLTQIYGNYMKLPPKEKRISHMPLEINYEHGRCLNSKEEYAKLNK